MHASWYNSIFYCIFFLNIWFLCISKPKLNCFAWFYGHTPFSNQPFNCTTWPLSGSPNCACYKASPLLINYLSRTPRIEAIETIFNVFGYETVLGWDSNLWPSRQRADALRVTPQFLVTILQHSNSTQKGGNAFSLILKTFPYKKIFIWYLFFKIYT